MLFVLRGFCDGRCSVVAHVSIPVVQERCSDEFMRALFGQRMRIAVVIGYSNCQFCSELVVNLIFLNIKIVTQK